MRYAHECSGAFGEPQGTAGNLWGGVVVRSMCRKRQSASVQRASPKNVTQIAATIAKWRLRHGFVGTHKVCKRHASLITLCALALLAVSGYSRVGAREGYIFYSGVCPHTILRCVALAFAYCFFQKKTRVASLQCPRRLGRGIGLSHNQLRKILRRRTLQRTRHHNGLQSGPTLACRQKACKAASKMGCASPGISRKSSPRQCRLGKTKIGN